MGQALRVAGPDVLAVAEFVSGSDNAVVKALVVREHPVLLTEAKDFGQQVYAYSQQFNGVILMRYPASAHCIENLGSDQAPAAEVHTKEVIVCRGVGAKIDTLEVVRGLAQCLPQRSPTINEFLFEGGCQDARLDFGGD